MLSASAAHDDGLDVRVEHFLLAVRELLEFGERPVQFVVVEAEAELLDTLAKRMAPAVLAEHQVGAADAHVLGLHDLVGRAVLEHAVLVNAGLVGEGIFARPPPCCGARACR